MQTQYQNTVEGWEEIPRQSKDLRSSRKLKQTNKLVLPQKYMFLKIRGLEKLRNSYWAINSKSSYSRPSFCNQLIKYSMFLV